MDDPAAVEAEITNHTGLLLTHDPGDPAFAASARRFAELHLRLVPDRGPADSVQGEIVRAVNRLAGEDRRNGNINWDDFYENMVRFLREHLAGDGSFAPRLQQRIAQDLDVVLRNGRGDRSTTMVAVDASFGRLIMAAVAFVAAKPEPIAFAGDASAAGADRAGAAARPRNGMELLLSAAWCVGAATIVLSWFHVVSPTVGWVGFGVALAAIAAQRATKRSFTRSP